MENYSGVEIMNSGWNSAAINYDPEASCCIALDPYRYMVKDIIDLSLFIILLIGLILIPFLIYRKHKGEKGLWKKIFKWDLIFFLIVFAIWVIICFIIWYLKSKPAMPSI